jgi:SAM-dependent methyltransferase
MGLETLSLRPSTRILGSAYGSRADADAMNPFVAANSRRYTRARPRYQGQVLQEAARVLGIHGPVERAVDVGCGTGHSSVALSGLAGQIVALDTAMTMLEVAEASDDIEYVAAAAERLPIRSGTVDLVTAGAVFHWLDGAAFLEAGLSVIVELGLFDSWGRARVATLFAGLPAYVVQVRCELTTLEQRERARGDRYAGTARGLFEQLDGIPFDHELVTDSAPPEQLADDLARWLKSDPIPRALEQLRQ